MRKTVIALLVTFAAALPAAAGNLSVTIGFDVPAYPTLQRIPNYPVYYAPGVRTNYFFYDGLYWVFDGGDWYSSTWYNGPWDEVGRYEVPVALLRVPVRYYRSKPVSFRTYHVNAAPHWHHYWGHTWAQRRPDWQHWDVRRAPAAAPLPLYQREYSRERYPVIEQQYAIQSRNYRYEPRDPVVRETYQERRGHAQRQSAPAARQGEAWGPPAHAPAYGYRQGDNEQRYREVDEGQRKRDKEEWKRIKEERKWEHKREKEARKWIREREEDSREQRQERYERVAEQRYRH